MIWVAHIAFGACIAAIMIFWARTDDGRSAAYALLVLGAISTVLVLEMEDGMLIWEAVNRVLIEFYEVGGAAIILVLAWGDDHHIHPGSSQDKVAVRLHRCAEITRGACLGRRRPIWPRLDVR
jgi:hypothetical protein